MDNSPTMTHEIREHAWPWWVRFLEFTRLDKTVSLVRRDLRHVPAGQRPNNAEALAYWALLRRIRSKSYDSRAILRKPKFAVADVAFNCILVRANQRLQEIAAFCGQELPPELLERMRSTESALEKLCDAQTSNYYSLCLSGDMIYESSIATLLPLYSGAISKKRAGELAAMLSKRSLFKTTYPIPSVPAGAHSFNPQNYWRGPTWLNMNWLVIDGLERYGFKKEANQLREKSLTFVSKSGFYEYFDPQAGHGLGAVDFSWTAALTIDLLRH